MSVTAGTIFQDSHLPLTIWFSRHLAVTSQKNGISALGLQRVLGLGSYKTAWAMLHNCAVRWFVQAATAYQAQLKSMKLLGRRGSGLIGRLSVNKAIIAVAVEEDGRKIGRVPVCKRSRNLTANLPCMALSPHRLSQQHGANRWLQVYLGLDAISTSAMCNQNSPKTSMCCLVCIASLGY